MAVEMLKPSPRGSWEKALVSSNVWLLFIALFASNLLRDEVGFWGSTAVVAIGMGLGTYLLVRMAKPQKEARLARDAERGVIELALRYADALPGSLRGRWLPGFAELSDGVMKFQPDYVDKGQPEGRITVYSDVMDRGQVDPPSKRPAELRRGWKIVALGTDKGELHVATGDSGQTLIKHLFT